MKRITLMLVMAIAAVIGAWAITPQEAYKALSNLPAINSRQADYNLPVASAFIDSLDVAGGYNLTPDDFAKAVAGSDAILGQIPLQYIINGGANGNVLAFVYALPAGEGTSDLLVAMTSRVRSMVLFIYGTVRDTVVTHLQAAPLEMEGDYLKIETDIPGSGDFTVILNKAR